MKKQPTRSNRRVLLRLIKAIFVAGLLPSFVLMIGVQTGYAGSATWNRNATSGDWNTASNWTPATIPNGPADVASFGLSNTTSISPSADVVVNGLTFDAAAQPYTFVLDPGRTLTVSGAGITNNSGQIQTFSIGLLGYLEAKVIFSNAATAGTATAFMINEDVASGQGLEFYNNATAGSATIIGGPGRNNTEGGSTRFFDNTTAGDGNLINEPGGSLDAKGGFIEFFDNSSADKATVTNLGGVINGAKAGRTFFYDTSTAANAVLIATGGAPDAWGGFIAFYGDSTGGLAQVKIFDNDTLEPAQKHRHSTSTTVLFDFGYLDVTTHRGSLSIGSLEGTGRVFLGENNLKVGKNNLSTIFDGIVENYDDSDAGHGSLTKEGGGKLSLTNANTYTGGTTVVRGALLIRNISGSGTGTGPVQVNGGTLGGTGRIAGAVTIGKGTGSGAFLAPGSRRSLGTLTIQSTITFNADATYDFAFNSTRVGSDQVTARGVTINAGALIGPVDNGTTILPPGTVFTAINNTAAGAIIGSFANLTDGSTIPVGNNTLQANYEGGDGNDLTLTVVP